VNGTYGPSVNRQIEAGLRNDPNSTSIIIKGRYVGEPSSEVSYTFNFRARCAQARASAEAAEPLAVRILGNPTTNDQVTVEIRGAEGQSLQTWMSNSQGQRINQPHVGVADAIERRTLQLGQQSGVYFLQVVTPTERKTVKLVHH